MSDKSLVSMFQRFATKRPRDINIALDIMKEHCKVSSPKGLTTINKLSEISTIPKMLAESDAVCFKSFLSKEEISLMLERIKNHPQLLTEYGKNYKVLGRVWSSDYIMDNADSYWEEAINSRARVEAVLPGIEDKLLTLCKEHIFKDENVVIREGFCGPAVVLFHPDGKDTGYGGDIHIDWEGLEEEHFQLAVPCYSFVCMLSLPEENGGTSVWNTEFVYNHKRNEDVEVEQTVVNYALGDFAMFPSFKLHNIESIKGTTDRVTLIFHVAYLDDYWKIWF